MIDTALKYRSLGWSVIPLSPGSKIPPKNFEVIPYRSELATEEEIKAWWKENPNYNIGIITGKISNLLVIDYDRYKEGFSEDNIFEYIPDSIVTPSVATPRGGEHQYFTFPTDLSIASGVLPGLDFRGEGGYIVAPPSVNGNGKKYEWLLSPFETPVTQLPQSFIDFLKQGAKNVKRGICKGANAPRPSVNCHFFSEEGRRDQDIFHIATLLQKGGASAEEMRIVLNILAQHCNPPFPANEVEMKINSAIKRADRQTRNITQEVRDWCLSSEGIFSIRDCYSMLKIVSSEDQHVARVAISNLLKEGKLEKYGDKRGMYRTPCNDAPIIDVQSADMEEYNIRFPLGVHELVKIHKSNVIIIAGESNAGKTAFCLNVARKNTDKKINYLSSEMQDGTELRLRLEEFNEPFSAWDHVSFRYRSDNFPDVIAPDDLNIIDYLDEGSGGEVYKMTRRIKDIADKLRKGIAIICLQKSSQKQFGFGGEGTKNAARLYLTITGQNRLTIEKAKVWRNKIINPNGMYCDFKLAGGCKFVKGESSWLRL